MHANVRANSAPLTGLDPSNDEVAGVLAEIWLREFACTLQTLHQVNVIAARYHEDAFDNTDAYIGLQFVQLPPHEMTGEQRHASRLLLGVGQSHSEINAALKSIGLSRGDIMDHNVTKLKVMAHQFQESQIVAEDAFGRLHHVSKQVWSLVNMLAFSNLFRFANPKEPFCIPKPDDAIFIPYIPTKQTPMHEDQEEPEEPKEQEPEPNPEPVCNDCGKTVDTMKMHHRMGLNPTDAYLCHPCGFKREFPDEYREEFSDDEDQEESDDEESDHDDEELSLRAATLAPFVNVPELGERNTRSRSHKFGRCEYCHAGLDDRADFICHTPTNVGFALMCNACHEQRNPGRAPDTTNFEF